MDITTLEFKRLKTINNHMVKKLSINVEEEGKNGERKGGRKGGGRKEGKGGITASGVLLQ